MNRDKPDTTTGPLQALSVFRGIYKRVADLLKVDPSYVSRVARGERQAPFITEALRKEIDRAVGKAGLHSGNGSGHSGNGHGMHLNGSESVLKGGRRIDEHRLNHSETPARGKSANGPSKTSGSLARTRHA